MPTTTEYGQIVPTTLIETVTASLGDPPEVDYDIPAIVADYRQAIQEQLPEGVTVHGEGDMYGPVPRIEFDRREVLEAVDFWGIAEHHDRTTTPTDGD